MPDETTGSPDPASPDLLASLAGSGGVRKFRANVTVAAVRWTGSNHDDVAALAGDAWPGGVAPNPPADDLIVDTPHGEARCQVGDWIIRGVTGKFFTCKPDIFEATYEPAETASSEADTAQDAPPAPGTGTSDPEGEPCPHCAKERERSVPEPDGEPVIDMGYLSLPPDVQAGIEQATGRRVTTVPAADIRVTVSLADLRQVMLTDGAEWRTGEYGPARDRLRAAAADPAHSGDSDDRDDGTVTVSRDDLQMALKFLVCYVPLDVRGADWAAVERLAAGTGGTDARSR